MAAVDDDEEFAYKLQLEEVLAESLADSQKQPPSMGGAAAGERPDTRRIHQKVLGLLHRWSFGEVPLEAESSSRQNDDEFFCNICFESKPLAEFFGLDSCPHGFCSDCISRHIAAKVEENIISISCPSCEDGILEPEECREILPKAVFERWGIALCESAVGSTEKLYCPYNDCSGMLINDDGGAINGAGAVACAQCPHCRRMFCARCQVPWHAGIDCAAFQELGEDERGQDDLAVRKIAFNSKWQRCPKCKMYVERSEGCVLIKCRCGYCFCYECASPMSLEKHFCTKCQKTW